ncbi:FadR/GntR family transcriptional regulator [Paenibacillus cisolokensis]|jgi:GntR family transcriptional repressor for pyruvate dehydrogenase complex|nr:FadR/GntR family transcriptional regulator [Paenibacillus cisolokensis]
MAFSKVSTKKVYELIAEQLKDHIVGGGWKAGDKLPSTKELSEQFQVGRSTMREALSALKAMGLIEIRHGEGCFVRSVDSADLRLTQFESLLLNRKTVLELLEARKALEISNAALAAEKRTADDVAEFEKLMANMEDGIGDEERGEAADIRFHRLLAEATHNSIMVKLLESISSQMEMAIRETRRIQMYSSKEVSLRLWREHAAIFEAVKAGDAAAAQERMREHLHHVEQVLLRYLGGDMKPRDR